MAFAVAALSACEKANVSDFIETPVEEQVPTKAFTFHVKGDFVTDYEEMTRAGVRLEENNTAGVTDLWVLDYVDGVKMQEVHQTSTQTGITFGSVPMNLTYGHHDIKFIASKGTEPTLTASALTWGRVKDTFVLDYPVDVVASSNGNRAPELKRAVSGITITTTDKVPANAKSITVEFERSQSLALPSLEAAALSVSSVTNDFPASWVGQTGSFSVYTLCPQDEMVTDVHVVVTAKDGTTISDFTVKDVELKKNRITTLKGEVFGRGNGFSVMIDDSWDEGLSVTF